MGGNSNDAQRFEHFGAQGPAWNAIFIRDVEQLRARSLESHGVESVNGFDQFNHTAVLHDFRGDVDGAARGSSLKLRK
jgi:hypothetical protein